MAYDRSDSVMMTVVAACVLLVGPITVGIWFYRKKKTVILGTEVGE